MFEAIRKLLAMRQRAGYNTILLVLLFLAVAPKIQAESYVFRLDKFQISKTRSLHEDTLFASLAVKIGDQPPQTVTKKIGDRNDGTYNLGLELGPVSLDNTTPVTFNFQLVNGGNHESDINGLLSKGTDTLFKAAASSGHVYVAAIAKLMGWLLADCDGPVAVDQVSTSGANLHEWAQAGPHTETRAYPGLESPDGCGGNSRYQVTWTVARVDSASKVEEPRRSQEGSQTFTVSDQQHYVGSMADELRHWWWEPGGGLHHDTWGNGISGQPVTLLVGEAQHAFARGVDGSLKHWWWDPRDGMHSDTWGSGVADNPSAILIGNQQHVFATGTDGSLNHWFWSPGGQVQHDSWGGGVAGRPSIMLVGEAQHAFARGVDGSLKHWWWDPRDGMHSDTWGSGVADNPNAILIGNQQHVFATGTDGSLNHWFWSPGGQVQHDSWGK
jgi:hypothetical protein